MNRSYSTTIESLGTSTGLKVPGNCVDLANETWEGHKTSGINREDKKCTCEMKKSNATKKKSGGMPMKTLIAQEMSKEMDHKCRTPSVIGRLMGLEEFPTASLPRKQIKEVENHAQNKLSWKQQQQSKSTPAAMDSSWKAQPLERNPNLHLFSTISPQCIFNHPDGERIAQDFRYLNNSHKKEQQKFKEDFETWQASKFKDYSMSFQSEKLKMHAVGNQIVQHLKPNEKKMALVRQKFMDAKRLATDVSLQQSKEFLEALEILQSNKDAFLAFLEQPNSLPAKKLEDSEFTSRAHSQLEQITVLKSSSTTRTCQWLEDNNKKRSLKKEVKNQKNLRQLEGQRDFGEKKESCELQSLHPTGPVSVCSLPDQFKQSHANGRNNSGSFPTRIVVLKPGPGKGQIVQSGSTSSSSPQDQTCIRDSKAIERMRSQNYLQEVRIRLEMEISKNSKEKSRNIMKGVEKQNANQPKYRSEIATEIKRHVRESLTRDLMNGAPAEVSTYLNDSSGNILLNRSEHSYGDLDQEVYTPVSKHSWYSSDRFSLPSPSVSALSDSSESTVNREAKRRLLERWRSTHGNVEDQQQQRVSNTLAEILSLPERKTQVSGSKRVKENGKNILPAEECQAELHDLHKLGSKNKNAVGHEGAVEWEGSLGKRNEDDNGNVSPTNLQRSRSVPTSAINYDRGIIERHCKASLIDARNAHGIDHGRSSSSLSTGSCKSKNVKSSKGKVSSMKCNFLVTGKWSNSKRSDALDFVQSSPNLQLQSDNELSFSMQQMAKESHQQNEKRESPSSPSQQEPCELLIDAPAATTETDGCSADSTSETSAIDEDDSKQSSSESSVRDPVSVTCQSLLCSVDANCMMGALPSISQPEFPSPCSPIKELPVFENHASESNIDKGEHPSPVSVLESPFQEELSSPKDIKEISSNLDELRIQLHQLKCDALERSMHKPENLLYGGSLQFKDHKIGDTDIVRGNTCSTPSEAGTPHKSKSIFSSIEEFNFVSLRIDYILCPEEQLPDLLYVRNVLVASGFTGDFNTIFTRWHSLNCPLDPNLFHILEDLYKDNMEHEKNFSDTELAKVVPSNAIKARRSKSERHLLYDCINEVLWEILGPFLNQYPWVRPTKMNPRPMAAGKQLLKETWARICPHLYPQAEVCHTLENLVTNDLYREAAWMELQVDVEIVGHEIERTIFNDLIEGVLCDLVS